MTPQPTDDRQARAALAHLVEPADPLLSMLLQAVGPTGALAAIWSETILAAVAAGRR